MVFDFSSCDWQGTWCYSFCCAALTSKINVKIRASLSPTYTGLQLLAVIVKWSLDFILAAVHEPLSIYLQQWAKMNSKLGLLLKFFLNLVNYFLYCIRSMHSGESEELLIKLFNGDFPCGPVVKNPPSNAGNTSSIPGRGTKIPQLQSPHALEPQHHN